MLVREDLIEAFNRSSLSVCGYLQGTEDGGHQLRWLLASVAPEALKARNTLAQFFAFNARHSAPPLVCHLPQ